MDVQGFQPEKFQAASRTPSVALSKWKGKVGYIALGALVLVLLCVVWRLSSRLENLEKAPVAASSNTGEKSEPGKKEALTPEQELQREGIALFTELLKSERKKKSKPEPKDEVKTTEKELQAQLQKLGVSVALDENGKIVPSSLKDGAAPAVTTLDQKIEDGIRNAVGIATKGTLEGLNFRTKEDFKLQLLQGDQQITALLSDWKGFESRVALVEKSNNNLFSRPSMLSQPLSNLWSDLRRSIRPDYQGGLALQKRIREALVTLDAVSVHDKEARYDNALVEDISRWTEKETTQLQEREERRVVCEQTLELIRQDRTVTAWLDFVEKEVGLGLVEPSQMRLEGTGWKPPPSVMDSVMKKPTGLEYHHAYAAAPHRKLKSKWTWDLKKVSAALSSFDAWYEAATDEAFYGPMNESMRLDAARYPKDSPKTKALWEDFVGKVKLLGDPDELQTTAELEDGEPSAHLRRGWRNPHGAISQSKSRRLQDVFLVGALDAERAFPQKLYAPLSPVGEFRRPRSPEQERLEKIFSLDTLFDEPSSTEKRTEEKNVANTPPPPRRESASARRERRYKERQEAEKKAEEEKKAKESTQPKK